MGGLDQSFIDFAITQGTSHGNQSWGQICKIDIPHLHSLRWHSKKDCMFPIAISEIKWQWFLYTRNVGALSLGPVTLEFTTLECVGLQQASIITLVSSTMFAMVRHW